MLVMVLAMDPVGCDTELTIIATIMAGLALTGLLAIPRQPSFFDKQLDFAAFFEKHKHRANFKVHICMAPIYFLKLLAFIWNDLESDEDMALLHRGAITPEIKLYCTI